MTDSKRNKYCYYDENVKKISDFNNEHLKKLVKQGLPTITNIYKVHNNNIKNHPHVHQNLTKELNDFSTLGDVYSNN
jgi:hypothetical protein